MTKQILNFSPFTLMLLIGLIIGASSCKSKKNMAQITPPEEIEEEITEEIVEQIEDTPAPVERVPEKIVSKEQKINNYFSSVTSASSTANANANINEALNMFSTPEAPVLIVIYKDGANPDYDEPTTIAKYLNYLKDTKSKAAEVEEVVYDSNGRIKELVLKK